jgi:hypothetical protein
MHGIPDAVRSIGVAEVTYVDGDWALGFARAGKRASILN